MTKRWLRSCRLVLVVSLTVSIVASSLCGVARADDRPAAKSFRMQTAAFSPIGRVYSFGGISINGHPASGEHFLWNGDLLEASDEATVNVTLDSIGKVTLRRAAVVRLATGFTTPNNNGQGDSLIATLIDGEMIVSLRQGSFAYIAAGDSAFAASDGATLRLTITDGRAVIDHVSGIVRAEPEGPKTKYIQFVDKNGASLGPDPRKKQTKDTSEDLFTLLQRPKPSSPKRVLFASAVSPTNLQTTPDLVPAPAGKVVSFTVDPPTNGTFDPSATVTTNSGGIANVRFTARVLGPARVTATDVETGLTAAITITVVKRPGIFRNRNLLIAAAAVSIFVCVFACGPSKGPLRQVQPPIIP